MASLNLLRWRPTRHYLLLWNCRYRYATVLIALLMASAICIYYYQPLLQKMRQQQQLNQRQLANFDNWQQRYEAHQQALKQQQRIRATNRTQAQVVRNFYQLTAMRPAGVQIERIHALPGELSISGEYSTIPALQAFVDKLQARFPSIALTTDFPRQQQYVLNGHWQSKPHD